MGDAWSCLSCLGVEESPVSPVVTVWSCGRVVFVLVEICSGVSRTTRPKIDKSLIGAPQNFQHTGHIGSTDFGSADLTAVHNQMHSKGGYEHSSHVPSEATPSGKEVITIAEDDDGGGKRD